MKEYYNRILIQVEDFFKTVGGKFMFFFGPGLKVKDISDNLVTIVGVVSNVNTSDNPADKEVLLLTTTKEIQLKDIKCYYYKSISIYLHNVFSYELDRVGVPIMNNSSSFSISDMLRALGHTILWSRHINLLTTDRVRIDNLSEVRSLERDYKRFNEVSSFESEADLFMSEKHRLLYRYYLEGSQLDKEIAKGLTEFGGNCYFNCNSLSSTGYEEKDIVKVLSTLKIKTIFITGIDKNVDPSKLYNEIIALGAKVKVKKSLSSKVYYRVTW